MALSHGRIFTPQCLLDDTRGARLPAGLPSSVNQIKQMTNTTTHSVQLDLSVAPMTLIRYRNRMPRVAFIYNVKPNTQRVIAIAELNGERVYFTTLEQIDRYVKGLRKENFIVQQPDFKPKAFVPQWTPPPLPKPKVLAGYKQSQVSTAEVTFTEDVALAL